MQLDTRQAPGAAIGMGNAGHVWTLVAGAGVGLVRRDDNVEWKTALDRGQQVYLPVCQGLLDRRVRRTLPERQVIDDTGNEAMAHIPVRVAVVGPPVVRVHGRSTAVGISGDVQRVRPRVG